MMVSIASMRVAEGVDVHLFDGPFRVGLPMGVLLFGGKEAYGKVIEVESDERVMVEIEGKRWWFVRPPERSERYLTRIGAPAELVRPYSKEAPRPRLGARLTSTRMSNRTFNIRPSKSSQK